MPSTSAATGNDSGCKVQTTATTERISKARVKSGQSILLSLTNQISRLRLLHADNFLIEVQADKISAVRVDAPKTTRLEPRHVESILNSVALRTQLRKLGYRGQPTSIFLHPPAVCVKTFEIGDQSPSKWIAEHLQVLSPLGNRSDLILSYAQFSTGCLVVAFVRRSQLLLLRDVLWAAGISIAGIYPAASAGLAVFAGGSEVECYQRWMLQDYSIEVPENSLIIMPRFHDVAQDCDKMAGRSFIWDDQGLLCGRVGTGIDNRYSPSRFNFGRQIGLAIPLSTFWIGRALRISLFTLLACFFLLILHWSTREVLEKSSPGRTAEIENKSQELLSLQTENEALREHVSSLQARTTGQHRIAPFLSNVRDALPERTWLNTLRIQYDEYDRQYQFALSAFSQDDREPSQFAGNVVNASGIAAASLVRSARSDERLGQGEGSSAARVTRFELEGKLSR